MGDTSNSYGQYMQWLWPMGDQGGLGHAMAMGCGLWAIMGDHGRSWVIMSDHGRSWAIMGDHGRSWAIMGDHG